MARGPRRRPERARRPRAKGTARSVASPLEVTRAISLVPYGGDVTFNAASPGATPSAQKKGTNPVPYGTEVHATLLSVRIRPDSWRTAQSRSSGDRASGARRAGRSRRQPRTVPLRLQPGERHLPGHARPGPRLLYIFEPRRPRQVEAPALLARVEAGDLAGCGTDHRRVVQPDRTRPRSSRRWARRWSPAFAKAARACLRAAYRRGGLSPCSP